MKVKSGKLQVGDVKHWKDGGKEVITQYDFDFYERHTEVNSSVEWLLEEPTEIKKITRKKPKEIELGPDDVMQAGDVIKYSKDDCMIVDGLQGNKVSSLSGYPRTKVFRPVKKSLKNPWKKTGRMIDEMEAAKIAFKWEDGVMAVFSSSGETMHMTNYDCETIHKATANAYKWLKSEGLL